MLVVGALSGCGGSHGAGRAARIDPHPMPADTLIMPAAEIGHYGGRFVMAVTSEPKTFCRLMANDQASNDIGDLMFAGLT